MEYRTLGSTGIRVSALGFGCGAVGGLMVRGDHATMTRAVARAVEAGITYFDTAQMYGDGISETNLGRVLGELKPRVTVGTKVLLTETDPARIGPAIKAAAELSLRRLQFERLDLFQLHNQLGMTADGNRRIGLELLDAIAGAFDALVKQGKIAHWGINGLGETAALHQAITGCAAETIQICFNLLNPSAARAMPVDFAFQDYQQLVQAATRKGMGVFAIRILAAGALSGEPARHPWAAQAVDPIATGADLAADVARAGRFRFLVERGWARSLAEAATRFALSQPGVSCALIGLSSEAQLEQAIAAAETGRLPAAAMDELDRAGR